MDMVKLVASYVVAVVLSLGGTLLLVWIWAQPAADGKEGIMALIAGFVGLSIQFLFQTNAMAAARGQTKADLLTPTA